MCVSLSLSLCSSPLLADASPFFQPREIEGIGQLLSAGRSSAGPPRRFLADSDGIA